MSWFLITIIAYFLNAIAMVIDKTLLKKEIPNPIVYTFYIALLGAVMMLLIVPFGFSIPAGLIIFISLVAGAVFIWALILMFLALRKDDATRVTPMIGGLTPIFVFVLAWYILQEQLTRNQYLAFIFLLSGTFLISLDFTPKGQGILFWLKRKLALGPQSKRISIPQIRKVIWIALPSASLFSVAYILTKYVYQNTEFLTGFIWTRLGAFLAAMLLLLWPENRKAIVKNFKKTSKSKSKQKSAGGKFLIGQACGGASALLIQYAISLGSVSLVQALQGLQYAFVFLIVLTLTTFLPKILKEEMSKEIFFQKVLAVFLIFIGLYFIAI